MKEEKQHERIDKRDGRRKWMRKTRQEGRMRGERRTWRQIEAMGRRGGGPSGAPSYCGRAFRMAFTSSATAVSANSNWSCRETKKDSLMSAMEALGR